MLTILDRKRENDRTYYFCKCDCGNSLWIRGDRLTSKRPTKSCGCLALKTQFKSKDIYNKKYGRLTAIKKTNKTACNGSIIWECECECGNKAYVPESVLERGETKSCGCLAREVFKENVNKAINAHLDKNIIEGTNIKIISRGELQSNNTSGKTGVMWDKSRNSWVSKITLKNKVYFLGRFKNKEDAIAVRKEAEEKLFKPIIDKYKKN